MTENVLLMASGSPPIGCAYNSTLVRPINGSKMPGSYLVSCPVVTPKPASCSMATSPHSLE